MCVECQKYYTHSLLTAEAVCVVSRREGGVRTNDDLATDLATRG